MDIDSFLNLEKRGDLWYDGRNQARRLGANEGVFFMTRDYVGNYYLNQNYNCAESLLRAANDAYQLGIPEESFKLVGGFGAGMGCGTSCGALCAGISAIGAACIQSKAHETAGLGDLTTKFVEGFRAQMGSETCSEIVKTFKKPDVRCLETVLRAADVLDQVMADLKKEPQ